MLGVVLTFVANKAKCQEELLSIALASILAGTGLANVLNLSPLLTCMMLGATLVNLMHHSGRVFSLINSFTPPIYLLFFTLAGASLNLIVLAKVGVKGATILDSQGMGGALVHNENPQVSIIGTLKSYLECCRPYNKTIFTVLESEELVEKVADAVKDVIGDINEPGAGLMFRLPVGKVYRLE